VFANHLLTTFYLAHKG